MLYWKKEETHRKHTRFEWGSQAVVLVMLADQQEKETTDFVALLGIKVNLKSKRRSIAR